MMIIDQVVIQPCDSVGEDSVDLLSSRLTITQIVLEEGHLHCRE